MRFAHTPSGRRSTPTLGIMKLLPALRRPNRNAAILLAANLAATALFLVVASVSWVEPELKDVPGASGGAPIVWALTALPIFALALVLNLSVLAWAAWVRRREGAWPLGHIAWGSLLFWVAAIFIDSSRHGA